MKKILILLIITLFSCEKYDGLPYKEFKIKKGEHSSNHEVELMHTRFIAYDVIFDSSVIYISQNTGNQGDINKLFGFADCNDHHHNNSARFGWRWNPDSVAVEILAYYYVNAVRKNKFLMTVQPGEEHTYVIHYHDDGYAFKIDNKIDVIVERGDVCSRGEYYLLYPYFGGDETAPHDVRIFMSRHFRKTGD